MGDIITVKPISNSSGAFIYSLLSAPDGISISSTGQITLSNKGVIKVIVKQLAIIMQTVLVLHIVIIMYVRQKHQVYILMVRFKIITLLIYM
jgi:hypothetical protein